MYIVLRLLLSFVHFAYNFYHLVQQQYTKFLFIIEQRRRGYVKKFVDRDYSPNELLINVPKIPRHLSIILGHEIISAHDVAKLIGWCVAAEIPCVSFYDHKGNLKKNLITIMKEVGHAEPSTAKVIEWSNQLDKPTNGVKRIDAASKNLHTKVADSEVMDASKHKTKVYFLSYDDCRGKIVNLIKSLAKTNDSSIFQDEIITPEFLDNKLNISNGTPDPDLAIVLGETMCTYGFMPWQTRVTEFLVVPTHHNISIDSFIGTLVKFSKCQQRYGK